MEGISIPTACLPRVCIPKRQSVREFGPVATSFLWRIQIPQIQATAPASHFTPWNREGFAAVSRR